MPADQREIGVGIFTDSLYGTEWAMVLVFIVAVVYWGWRMHHKAATMESAFLAGRSVNGVIASFSTVATNLNANDFLGLTGAVYAVGIVMSHGVFMGSVVLLIAAMILMPRLRALNVYSLGGWLECRYNAPIGVAYSVVWTFIWMLFNLGLYIYAGSKVLETLLGWDLDACIFLLTIVAALYTLMGGFGAVVATDVLQLALMFFPLAILSGCCLFEMGGLSGLAARLPESHSNFWAMKSDLGYLPVALFGMFFMGMSYWSCEAQVVQRPLASKDPENASISYLGASMWYAVLVPFVIIIPGLTARVLYPHLLNNDHAMPELIKHFLPTGLYGIAVVGLIAGFLSSADSQINAFCTMFTADLYQRFVSPGRSESHYVGVSRVAGVVGSCVAVGAAFAFKYAEEGMFLFAVGVLAVIMPPFGAITILGATMNRINNRGAMTGLIVGGVVAVALFIASRMGLLTDIAVNDLYFRGTVTFALSAIFALAVSYLTPPDAIGVRTDAAAANYVNTPRLKRMAAALFVVTLAVYVFWTAVFF